MNNDYSFEQFQKRRKEIKNKAKNTDTKTPLNLFVKTFAIFLFSFLLIATIISPHINIPALSDDDSSLKDISSSDFKSRIDYRLKQIQADDTTKPSAQTNPQEGSDLQNILSTQGNSELSTFNTPKLPDKTVQTTTTESSKVPTLQQGQYIPLKPQSESQQSPAPYVPKAQVQPSKNYRILVGDYVSPEDAQRVADLMSGASGTRPMIKSHNGSYCLQVGVYNDAQKAQNVAGAYSAKNYKVRVIEN